MDESHDKRSLISAATNAPISSVPSAHISTNGHVTAKARKQVRCATSFFFWLSPFAFFSRALLSDTDLRETLIMKKKCIL